VFRNWEKVRKERISFKLYLLQGDVNKIINNNMLSNYKMLKKMRKLKMIDLINFFNFIIIKVKLYNLYYNYNFKLLIIFNFKN